MLNDHHADIAGCLITELGDGGLFDCFFRNRLTPLEKLLGGLFASFSFFACVFANDVEDALPLTTLRRAAVAAGGECGVDCCLVAETRLSGVPIAGLLPPE